MTQANEHDVDADQKRRWFGQRPPHLGKQAGTSAAGGARRRPGGERLVRHAGGRPGRPRAPDRNDPGRAGRTREGAAALDDPCDHGPRGTRARAAGATPHRQAAGGADGDGRGQATGEPVPPAQGRVAGDAVARADAAGGGDAAGGRADPGEAEPGLTARSGAGRPGAVEKAHTRIFSSLRIRNYRLYAAGQVISNTGTWMQRVAQDWLVLELTHGSGTALG